MQIRQRRCAESPQCRLARADRPIAPLPQASRAPPMRRGLIERQPPRGARTRASSPSPVSHRPQSARDTSPCGAGGESRSCGLLHVSTPELRALELRRECQKPRRAASSNFAAMWLAAERIGGDEKRAHRVVAERRVEHQVELPRSRPHRSARRRRRDCRASRRSPPRRDGRGASGRRSSADWRRGRAATRAISCARAADLRRAGRGRVDMIERRRCAPHPPRRRRSRPRARRRRRRRARPGPAVLHMNEGVGARRPVARKRRRPPGPRRRRHRRG